MNEGRDKFLTEAMGGCWHELEKVRFTDAAGGGDFYYRCSKCKLSEAGFVKVSFSPVDFSTWEGLGKLVNFLDATLSDEEIADIFYKEILDGCAHNLPGKIANAVYEKIKEQ